MTPCDPMAVAVDWLDAYPAARINQMVGMYRPDALIECACDTRRIIQVRKQSRIIGGTVSLRCPLWTWKTCSGTEGQCSSPIEQVAELFSLR
jgi:hypothetical protein